MKTFYTLPLTCLLIGVVSLAHGQSRPSVSGNATRINTLENNQVLIRTDVNGNSSELALLQQQIDANRASIDAQVPIQGPAGPAGAPGPLSGLQCELGQFAAWDGSVWVCTSMAGETAPLSDDECIRGFGFSSRYDSLRVTEQGWNVLCEDKTQREFTLSGPFTINPIDSSTRTSIELATFPDFSARIVDVFIHPVFKHHGDTEGMGGELVIKVTLTALFDRGSSEVGAWASVYDSTLEPSLNINFADGRLSMVLRKCVSEDFSSKPRLIGRDYFIQEKLELKCISQEPVLFSEHPKMEALISMLQVSRRSTDTGRLTILFDEIGLRSLNQFNRQHDNSTFEQYVFPRLSFTLPGLVPVGKEFWQASSHSLVTNYSDNLPQ